MKRFGTEDYFSQYEFTKPHQLASSDCESVSITELIKMGGGTNEEFLNLKLGYPEMPGSRLLRKEISQLYSTVNEEQVLVLGSPIEGIYLSMQALLKRNDHVVVLSPAYDALFNVAEHLSGNVSRWYLKNDGNMWSLDFDQLESVLRANTKLLVVNFPHNPTGFIPNEKDINRIIQICAKYGVQIFSDEIYYGLELEANHRFKSIADQTPKSITMSGASKGLGLPGLRFGWLIIKDPQLYDQVLSLKTYTSMCAHQANEYLGIMAVRAAPQLLVKNLMIINANLRLAEEFFKKHEAKLTWLRPFGGSISVFKLNEGSAEKFCHEMAIKFGVVLLPILHMGYEDKFVRMGFGRKSFADSLAVFDKAITS